MPKGTKEDLFLAPQAGVPDARAFRVVGWRARAQQREARIIRVHPRRSAVTFELSAPRRRFPILYVLYDNTRAPPPPAPPHRIHPPHKCQGTALAVP